MVVPQSNRVINDEVDSGISKKPMEDNGFVDLFRALSCNL
jgi:hypothetical protein